MKPSKTDLPCDCGYLDRAAKDPDHPIEFDARLNEFNVIHAGGRFRIYHCPFCGGKAPESIRAILFSQVSREEQDRLFRIADTCKNLDDVVASIGPPDRDAPMGSSVGKPELDGQPPRAFALRRLTYARLSDSADLHFDLHPDGRVASYSVSGKYLGTPGVVAT
jgi:hypothetical protein